RLRYAVPGHRRDAAGHDCDWEDDLHRHDLQPNRHNVKCGGCGAGIVKPFGALIMRRAGPGLKYAASLLHFNGANGSSTITDERGRAWVRFGNAQISTAQSKFGGASLLLDGAGDWVETGSSLEDFRFGLDDF